MGVSRWEIEWQWCMAADGHTLRNLWRVIVTHAWFCVFIVCCYIWNLKGTCITLATSWTWSDAIGHAVDTKDPLLLDLKWTGWSNEEEKTKDNKVAPRYTWKVGLLTNRTQFEIFLARWLLWFLHLTAFLFYSHVTLHSHALVQFVWKMAKVTHWKRHSTFFVSGKNLYSWFAGDKSERVYYSIKNGVQQHYSHLHDSYLSKY